MEFFAHVPAAVYVTAVVIIAVVIMRLIADGKRVAAVQTIHRLALEKTKRHHRPKLTLLVTAQSAEGALATVAAFRAQYSTIETIVLVSTATQPKLAGQLRYQLKKQQLTGIRVAARKQPDAEAVLAELATGTLVVALPEGSRPVRAFYQLAIMPFIDKTVHAVIPPRIVRPGATLASGGEALFWAWCHYIGQLFRRHATIAEASFANGVIMRRSTLGKSLDPSAIHTTCQAASTIAAETSMRRSVASIMRQVRRPLVLVAALAAIAALVVGTCLSAQNSTVTIAFAVVAVLASWWALRSTAAYGIFTSLTLVLLMPFFFVALLGIAMAYAAAAAVRSTRALGRPLVRRRA